MPMPKPTPRTKPPGSGRPNTRAAYHQYRVTGTPEQHARLEALLAEHKARTREPAARLLMRVTLAYLEANADAQAR